MQYSVLSAAGYQHGPDASGSRGTPAGGRDGSGRR